MLDCAGREPPSPQMSGNGDRGLRLDFLPPDAKGLFCDKVMEGETLLFEVCSAPVYLGPGLL